jgi:hypothetical protein
MPRRNIYIKDEDVEFFNKAEEIASIQNITFSELLKNAIREYLKNSKIQVPKCSKCNALASELYVDKEANILCINCFNGGIKNENDL